MIRLVKQEAPWACAIACIAMVTGWSYRSVKALFPDEVSDSEGLSQWEIMQAFAWFGYALRIFGVGKYRYVPTEASGLAGRSDKRHLIALKTRGGWPEIGDAEMSIVTVRAAGGLHCAVVTRDGTVYDPYLDDITTLDTYDEVIWVGGIHPVCPREEVGDQA